MRNEKAIHGFKGMQVANIDDCMGRNAALHSSIHQMNPHNLLGPALTVKVPAGDNLMVFLAIEEAMPGDILVIDGDGFMNRALVGEIVMKFAQSKRVGGLLINGCVRDYEALKDSELPVFAKGRSPNGPYRESRGEIGVPVSIGGKVIFPGDIIIGDSDGVIAVRPKDAEGLQQKVLELEKREVATLSAIQAGTWDLGDLHRKIGRE